MRARRAACTTLLALAAFTASCSSGDSDDKPEKPAPTVTATKTVDQAAAREACVDAWAEAIQANTDAGLEDEPAACAGLPEEDQIDRYMEGLRQRNEANRQRFDECTEDPTCTSVPVIP
jgi:hypothetical protein